jgi:prefoldin subunit 5
MSACAPIVKASFFLKLQLARLRDQHGDELKKFVQDLNYFSSELHLLGQLLARLLKKLNDFLNCKAGMRNCQTGKVLL